MDTSCWTCAKNDLTGVTFLGMCGGFRKGTVQQPAREIPARIADQGCMLWVEGRPAPIERGEYEPGVDILEEGR